METELITITLSAYEIGGDIFILDKDGKTIKKTKKYLASEMRGVVRENFEAHLKWKDASRRWASQYGGMVTRKNYSGWKRKAQTWQQSLRWRRNRTAVPRIGNIIGGIRQRKRSSDWSDASKLLLAQYMCKKLRNERPWLRWAQTVHRNLRAKNEIREEARSRSS